MNSQRTKEGYLIIDHRASPGNALAPEGQVWESPTVTCSHCGSVVVLSPTRKRPRHYCPKCDHYVCDKPGCVLECRPWMRVIEAVEKAAHHGGPIIIPGEPNLLFKEKEKDNGKMEL